MLLGKYLMRADVRRGASHARELRSDRQAFAAPSSNAVVVSYSVESCSADCSAEEWAIFGVVASSVAAQLGPLPKDTLQHTTGVPAPTSWTKADGASKWRPRRGIDRDRVSEGTENSTRPGVDQTVLIRVSNEAFTTMKGRRPGHRTATSPTPRSARTWVVRSDSTSKNCNCGVPVSPIDVQRHQRAVRSSVRRRDHCRNCRSTSDSSGYLRSQSDYTKRSSGFWERK